MSIHKIIIGRPVLMLLLVLVALGGSGCGSTKKAVVVSPEPTCQEALSTGLNSFSEHELAILLDQGLADDQKDLCWIPLIEDMPQSKQGRTSPALSRGSEALQQKTL